MKIAFNILVLISSALNGELKPALFLLPAHAYLCMH